jgi:serine/threonine-protein kinase
MPTPPDRLSAALADRYLIDRELGQGGMATVYLAHDPKHDRKVAIKVLRAELAAVIGAERFLREIKTIANLQHPHILGLIDSGEVNGTAYYVMPFVEGESLRDRLTREKQLPIGDALRLATEVAAALDYAHRHGVIHRDIKPENVLLHDGSALVADFGIALAVSSAGGTRMTETGMSLGTPHYMSPEQAMGEREITARSDVYALGAMSYEMLLGEPPFTGPTAQAIVAKVMTEKPAPLTARRDTIPAEVEAAVLTALAKLPADRFGSAAEFAAALRGGGTGLTAARPLQPSPATSTRVRVAVAVAAVASLVALALAVRVLRPAPAPVTRLTLDLPDLRVNHLNFTGSAFVLSRDGARIAYIAQPVAAPSQLMVRERGDLTPRLIPGTEGADGPFFSPDGRWIGYSAGGKLYKVPVDGGPPVVLTDAATEALSSGTWGEDDRILFTTPVYDLAAVPASGGTVEILATAPPKGGMGFPTLLPGGDAVVLTECTANCASMAVIVLHLETLARDTLVPNGTRAWYLRSGHLLVLKQDGSLVGGRFDPGRRRFAGPVTVLLTGVQLELGVIPELSVADDGTLVYLASNQGGIVATPARVDRRGVATVLDPDWTGSFSSQALSPDGRRLAVSLSSGATNSLWMKQLEAGPLTRLSFDGTLNYRPAWRADGRSLSFTSDRSGASHLYQTRADGSSRPERLMPDDTAQVDEALWSRDGRWLVYRTGVAAGFRDIYARPLTGDTSRVTVAAGQYDEYSPALSPDGRWIAYVSLESGREEVYVRPFPDAGRARWQVSTGGGNAPAWAHSGRELFYVSRADSLVTVSVSTAPDFQAGARRTLFSTREFTLLPFHRSYDVTADDQQFILPRRTQVAGAEANRLTVVLSWFSEMEARLAAAP